MANPHNAAIEGWGDEIAQYYVVEDMLKLDPGQLMFIFESVTGRADLDSSDFGLGHGSKGLVEAYIASLGDWFENNGETLVETIGFVVGERGGDFDETRELVEDGWEGIARKGRGGG